MRTIEAGPSRGPGGRFAGAGCSPFENERTQRNTVRQLDAIANGLEPGCMGHTLSFLLDRQGVLFNMGCLPGRLRISNQLQHVCC
ncbi:hypothetical protein ABBQ38_010688 [Trebouxia sp. C0009 RCD-2024]